MAQHIFKKAFSLLLLFCHIGLASFGQKTEINLNTYTGLFSFHGSGSTQTSKINYNSLFSPEIFTSNVYGKKSSFSYAFELQAQRVTKKNIIYGLGISFESLTSQVSIDTVTDNDFYYGQYPATGKTTLRNVFITANPFVGHQYNSGKFIFDLSAGIDLGLCLKSHESGSAYNISHKSYVHAENDKARPSLDFRPRVQVRVAYKKLGVLFGYSLGLTNYQNQTSSKACSGFLRFGLSFKIK